MFVAKLEAKFNEPVRFAPQQMDTESRRVGRFVQDLNPWFYNKVVVLGINDFSTLVEKAKIDEKRCETLSHYNREHKKEIEKKEMVVNLNNQGDKNNENRS